MCQGSAGIQRLAMRRSKRTYLYRYEEEDTFKV